MSAIDRRTLLIGLGLLPGCWLLSLPEQAAFPLFEGVARDHPRFDQGLASPI